MKIVNAKAAYLYSYDNGCLFPDDWYITNNFKWNDVFKNECRSDGSPILEVFNNAIKISHFIQEIRERIGKPINIHCWVRSIPHNKRAGSKATLSPHINGCAIDFDVTGITIGQARALISAMKLPIRIEDATPDWVHIDVSSYVSPFAPGVFKV